MELPIAVVEIETRVEWEADKRMNVSLFIKPDWLSIQQYCSNQSGLVNRERMFIHLFASHSTRVSIPTIAIRSPFYILYVSITYISNVEVRLAL